MSCNLGRTDCARCHDSEVRIDTTPVSALEREGPPSLLASARRYPEMVAPHLFADATCVTCGARYVAWMTLPWVDVTGGGHEYVEEVVPPQLEDLSYRSSFNDETDGSDLPAWDGKTRHMLTSELVEAAKWALMMYGLDDDAAGLGFGRIGSALAALKRYEA